MKKVLSLKGALALIATVVAFGGSAVVGVSPAAADINIVKMHIMADTYGGVDCRSAQYISVRGVPIKVMNCIDHLFISCYRDSDHANTGWCGVGWYMSPKVVSMGWLACSKYYYMRQNGSQVNVTGESDLKCAPSAPYFPG